MTYTSTARRMTVTRPSARRYPPGWKYGKPRSALRISSIQRSRFWATNLRPQRYCKVARPAEYLGQAVEGTFTWISALAQGNRLTVTRSSIEEVRFTPKDETNYLTASAKVRIQSGTEPSSTYKIKITTEGEGSVEECLTGSLWYPKEGPFYEDMELSLKVIAGTGHRFAGFLIEGITYAQSPYTIRVSKDMEVTARFIPKEDPANPSDPTAPDALKVTIDVPSPCVYDGTPKLVGVSSTPALKGFQIKYLDKDKNAVIPVEAGPYQVIVTRPEDEIYKAYSRTVSLTVSKASPVITRLPTASVIPVGAPLEDSRLSGGGSDRERDKNDPGYFRMGGAGENDLAKYGGARRVHSRQHDQLL